MLSQNRDNNVTIFIDLNKITYTLPILAQIFSFFKYFSDYSLDSSCKSISWVVFESNGVKKAPTSISMVPFLSFSV